MGTTLFYTITPVHLQVIKFLGVSDEVGSQKEQDKGVDPLPNKSELQEKRESEKPKESKTLPPKPYMPPVISIKVCKS